MTDTRASDNRTAAIGIDDTDMDDGDVVNPRVFDTRVGRPPLAAGSGDGFTRAFADRTATSTGPMPAHPTSATPTSASATTSASRYPTAWDEPTTEPRLRTAPAKTPFVLALLWLGSAVAALILAADPYFAPITRGVLGRDGTGLLGLSDQAGARIATAVVALLPLLVAILFGARSVMGRAVGVITAVVAAIAFYVEPSPGVNTTWWIPAAGVVIAYAGWLVARDRKSWAYLTLIPVAAAAIAWNDATGWSREIRHLTDHLPWNVYSLSVGWAYLALPIVVGIFGLLAAAAGRRRIDDDDDDLDEGLFR